MKNLSCFPAPVFAGTPAHRPDGVRSRTGWWLVWLLVVGLLTAARPALASPDTDLVASRLRADALAVAPPSNTTLSDWLNQQNANGSWTAINYADRSAGTWAPVQHVQRLLGLAQAYHRSGNTYYQSATVLNAIVQGLNFYVSANPSSTNWWHTQIGEGDVMGPLLIMMQPVLRPATGPAPMTAAQFQGAVSRLRSNLVNACYGPGCTGQNIVWVSSNIIYRGCLEANDAWVATAFNDIQGTIVVTQAEGIQHDNSFHQHGPQIYNGGYGRAYIDDISYWLYTARGTSFAFNPTQINIVTNLLLDGHQWMVRGKMYDHSVVGREFVRPVSSYGTAPRLIGPATRLLASAAPRQAELTTMRATLQNTQAPSLSGNRHFWRSDYMSHARPAYLATTRLHSTRTIGMETVNQEGLRSFFMSYGANLLYRTGEEYFNIFPVWDWARIPGVTAEHVSTFPNHTDQRGLAGFVGGVSDGETGAAAFDIQMRSSSLRGRKAWFYFNEAYVCLGAGLTATQPNPIYTSLNQCLLIGAVTAKSGGTAPATVATGQRTLTAPQWVHHDGVGYVFPAAANTAAVVLKNEAQTGSWSLISGSGSTAPVSSNVFSLWLDHGLNPTNATYQYVVVPGMNPTQLDAYAAALPVRVLANTPALQAVRHDAAHVTQAAFYQAGSLPMAGARTLTVDQPCLVVLRETTPALTLAVSNPHNAALTVLVTLTGSISGPGATYSAATNTTTISVALPGGTTAGQSVVTQFLSAPLAVAGSRALVPAYPNPVVEQLTLPGTTPGTAVQVRDLLGRTVLTTTVGAGSTVDLRALPAGAYLVRIGASPQQYRVVKASR